MASPDETTSTAPPTVLITGGTGFIGSHVVHRLSVAGCRIVVLKRADSDPWRIQRLLPTIACCNIQEHSLEPPFVDFGPIDAVIHLATCYGRRREPASEILKSNTLFPLQLLETAIGAGCRLFINTDSFFNRLEEPYAGLPEYSRSKRAFREWGTRCAAAGKARFVTVSLEHVFGPWDGHEKFVPFLISQLIENVPFINLTPGDQTRDFIFVDDVAAMFATIVRAWHTGHLDADDYEVGRGNAVSLRAFVELVKQIVGATSELRYGAIPHRPHEIMHSQANIAALQKLGWSPQISIEQGLKATIDASRLNLQV